MEIKSNLGFFPSIQYDDTHGKERWQLLQNEVPGGVEEESYCKWSVCVSKECGRNGKHKIDCCNANFSSIQFLGKHRWQILSSSANLHTWGKIDMPNYKALGDGQYWWWHNRVLVAIEDTVMKAIQTSSSHIAQTTLWPDLIIISNNTKKIIMWELSVSWEDNIILANERKREKSQELVKESAKWLENLLRSNWSGMQGLCGTFIKQSTCKNCNRGISEEKSLEEMFQGNRTGIPVEMISGIRH